ncbi:hypothetical protein CHELA20_54403 [Hyphomicrobiales bacterium]|nr:hypothetical protein CHELA41_20525 [Hyphomicrobiales bacterium]CAH1686194.1 hypothetical protein CHELA20_54403 [Hyphomicrobiales bacterium]
MLKTLMGRVLPNVRLIPLLRGVFIRLLGGGFFLVRARSRGALSGSSPCWNGGRLL